MSTFEQSLKAHESHRGKLSVQSKLPINNHEDLSLVYTPGVAAPCEAIASDPDAVYQYTIKGNTVAVVTDGSAVLGLGDIGPAAGLPVMEGKCALFQRFAGIDAFPICIDANDPDEFVDTLKRITAPFGGINLEDIGSPHCFEIEQRLKEELDIPVFHDDQHGTAIVVLAALSNALKLTHRSFEGARIVISGAGAAGSSIVELLLQFGAKDITVCDRRGAIYAGREDMMPHKDALAAKTNPQKRKGDLADMMKGADVFIGVSGPRLVDGAMIQSMATDPIAFALANPLPEIMPDEARDGGAAIVATGRSDFPNQVNNVLAFPGIFRGVLDAHAKDVTPDMYVATAKALAAHVQNPVPEKIIPDIFDDGVTDAVASAVKACVL